jgi:hypothetical protein
LTSYQQDIQRSVAAHIGDVGKDIRTERLLGRQGCWRRNLIGAVLLEALQRYFLVSFELGEVGRRQPMNGLALFVRGRLSSAAFSHPGFPCQAPAQ